MLTQIILNADLLSLNPEGKTKLKELSKRINENLTQLLSSQAKDYNINQRETFECMWTEGNRHERDITITLNFTLFHSAIIEGNQKMVEELLKFKPDLMLPYEKTELTVATEYNVRGSRVASPKKGDRKEIWLPVELASQAGNLDIAKLLVNNNGTFDFKKLKEAHRSEIISCLQKHSLTLIHQVDQMVQEKNTKDLVVKAYEGLIRKTPVIEAIIKIQAGIRGYLNRSLLKKESRKRKKTYANNVEKKAIELIEVLAKKRRFMDINKINSLLLNESAPQIRKEIAVFFKEISAEKNVSYHLLVGEGDFSFAADLVVKLQKKQKPFFVVATETKTFRELENLYKNNFKRNRQELEKNEHVRLLEKIDAVTMSNDTALTQISNRFQRIYFNCPHDGKSYKESQTTNILSLFFKEANNLQKSGDKVKMLLPKKDWRHIKLYDIYPNTVNAGYDYSHSVGKVAERFPGYEHRKTHAHESVFKKDELKQYVFVRTDYNSTSLKWKNPPVLFESKDSLHEGTPFDYDSSLDTPRL